jgi:flagellar P-ring protein precursor FlgI
MKQIEAIEDGMRGCVDKTLLHYRGRKDVKIGEEKDKSIELPSGATVEQLVKALTAIGATPRDIIAILQNLKAAGALDADLEVI